MATGARGLVWPVGGLGKRLGEQGLPAAVTGLSGGRTHGQALTRAGKLQKLKFRAG